MRLIYGNYFHDENEAAVVINLAKTFNDAQQSLESAITWNITGQLHAANQNALAASIALLEAAYSADYRDLILLGNDNSTICHSLRNAGSSTGVRIINFSYPKGDGAQYTTFRDYAITAEAKYSFTPRETSQLESYSETVQISGGGPEYVMVALTVGPAVRQRTRNFTPCMATQSGSASGRFRYPIPPNPIWPQYLMRSPTFTRTSPQRTGPNSFENWTVTWSYEFGSPHELSGLPNLWPG